MQSGFDTEVLCKGTHVGARRRVSVSPQITQQRCPHARDGTFQHIIIELDQELPRDLGPKQTAMRGEDAKRSPKQAR